MEKLLEYFMIIRNSKPTVIATDWNEYTEALKKEFPIDADLGKYIRNN
jgi:hypothetical protein